MGPPPSMGGPMAGAAPPYAPYGGAAPSVGGPHYTTGSVPYTNGYPPFEPPVNRGFDVGRTGGGIRNGDLGLGSRRSDFDRSNGGGRGGFDSRRGGRMAGGGGRGFDGGRGGGGRGFSGVGRGGFGRGGGRGGRRGDDLDSLSLPKQEFRNLVPFKKDFYVESPSVQAMSDQEVAMYRARREITVEGHDVPKPVRMFHEVGFPGILLLSFLWVALVCSFLGLGLVLNCFCLIWVCSLLP